MQRFKLALKFFASVLVLGTVALALVFIMKLNNFYASGNDIWGHLLKSDLMYRNITKGNLYPLYTDLWYNGVQPYRYWAPLPYYLMSVFQGLAGGNIVRAYYLFAGFSLFAGGFAWLLWGLSSRKMLVCSSVGLIWFFMPENFRVFFCEGNLPRMVTAIIIPYLVYFIWRFVYLEKNASLAPVIILMGMLVLSHVMIAAMACIGCFIFFAIYSIQTNKALRPVYALTGMLLSFALCGIWLFPALKGGLVGMDANSSTEVMKSLTYSLAVSLNPFNRINGTTDTFYFGVSVVLVSVIGILLANKKEKAGFYTAILILLATTTTAVPILSKLPLNQLLWMMRFSTIAYALFFLSLLTWDKCKLYFMLILIGVILLDCIPSFDISRYYTQVSGKIDDALKIAKGITKQRVALIDLSTYGSYPAWELSEGENPAKYTYGWAWQGAATSSNIVMLNAAMENGNFDYMFDRCLELGNDTVIIKKKLVNKANKTADVLKEAASESEYELYKETDETYIFHRNVSKTFGVVTDYKGLAIGKSASQIVLLYPEFTVGNSDNIEDYSYADLSKYKVIYLSDFKFGSRKAAEDIIQKLSNKGVKVVIDMNKIPPDTKTNRMTFLGVTAEEISFQSVFPTLDYSGTKVIAKNFVDDYDAWNTVYLNNVKHSTGMFNYEGENLDFLGTSDNGNIIFVGCNIIYHAVEADDTAVLDIVSDIFKLQVNELPHRKLVDVDIKYSGNKIIIDSPVEEVNTTLSYQDNFKSDSGIKDENNLLVVSKKHTEIQLVYPYLIQGTIISVIGLVGIAALFFLIVVKRGKNKLIHRSNRELST